MSYEDCPDAYADAVYNIPKVHPSYSPDLDSDLDGVACEQTVTGGKDLSNYKPSATTTMTVTPTGANDPTSLPVTGTDGTAGFTAAGLFLAFGGTALVLMARKRYLGRHR